MRRSIVAATALVAGAAAAAVLLFAARDPGPGPVPEEDWILPGGQQVDRRSQDRCHPEVPGWSLRYRIRASPAAVEARLVRLHGEPVAGGGEAGVPGRAAPRPPRLLRWPAASVSIGDYYQQRSTSVRVTTYDTADHECPPDGARLWDADPVTTFTLVAQGRGIVGVDGARYGFMGPGTPPPDATVREFAGGALRVALHPDAPRGVAFVSRDGEPWARYTSDRGFPEGNDDPGLAEMLADELRPSRWFIHGTARLVLTVAAGVLAVTLAAARYEAARLAARIWQAWMAFGAVVVAAAGGLLALAATPVSATAPAWLGIGLPALMGVGALAGVVVGWLQGTVVAAITLLGLRSDHRRYLPAVRLATVAVAVALIAALVAATNLESDSIILSPARLGPEWIIYLGSVHVVATYALAPRVVRRHAGAAGGAPMGSAATAVPPR